MRSGTFAGAFPSCDREHEATAPNGGGWSHGDSHRMNRTRVSATLLTSLALFVPLGVSGGSARNAIEPAIVQRASRFASPDGRCHFEQPKLVRVRAPRSARERIERTLEIALSETDESPDHAASPSASIAACRKMLAESAPGSSANVRPTYLDARTMRVTFQRDGVLGLSIERLAVLTPSAHPETAYAAYAFELASGRAYTTREMFQPGSDNKLRELVVSALHRSDLAHPSDPDIAPLYASGPPHFGAHDVLLRTDGIDIYNLFEAHALAGVVAHISAAELRAAKIIAPRGPLRVFL